MPPTIKGQEKRKIVGKSRPSVKFSVFLTKNHLPRGKVAFIILFAIEKSTLFWEKEAVCRPNKKGGGKSASFL